MWSSDYPHTDSPWPNSRRFIDSWSGSIDQGARDKITGGNAAALYHVN
jgi:predicted TIM-barrel fold metal-dependent hydrolase